MKHVTILGSTGSIGTQTLNIVRAYRSEFTVEALAAKGSVEKLEAQTREFAPKYVCLYDERAAEELRVRLRDLPVRVLSGMDGLLACVALPETELVVTAMVGMIGLRPTVAAIEAGKDIALANKETLVTAGHLILPLIREQKVALLPVDSEHSAIFQSLQGLPYAGALSEGNGQIARILLTASGGPFRGKTLEEMRGFTAEDALRHPNWAMGKKITVDSATMVNKGLEMMEARWLFGVEPEQITVLVHPQSILHSAVEFADGAVIGQMGVPSMELPIQYALFYPERKPMQGHKLDLFQVGTLTFEKPDPVNFPAFGLASEVMRRGGSLPTVYNAANEWAVARFLAGEIGFTEIGERIQTAVERHKNIPHPSLSEILNAEQETYELLEGSSR